MKQTVGLLCVAMQMLVMQAAQDSLYPSKVAKLLCSFTNSFYNKRKTEMVSVDDCNRVVLYDISKDKYIYNQTFPHVVSVGYSEDERALFIVSSDTSTSTKQTVLSYDLETAKKSKLCSGDDILVVKEDEQKNLLMVGKGNVSFYDRRKELKEPLITLENFYDEIRAVDVDHVQRKMLVMTQNELKLFDLSKCYNDTVLLKATSSEYLRTMCRRNDTLLITTDLCAKMYTIAHGFQEIYHVRSNDPDAHYLTSGKLNKQMDGALLTANGKVIICDGNGKRAQVAFKRSPIYGQQSLVSAAHYDDAERVVLAQTNKEVALYHIARKVLYKLFTASDKEDIGPVSFSANEKEIYVPTSQRMLTFANPLD